MRAFVAFLAVFLFASAAAAQDPALPPGHPSFGGQPAAPGAFQPPPDSASPDRTIPPGSVVIDILDAKNQPVANTKVRLEIARQSVAEGDQNEVRAGTSSSDGKVSFAGLSTSSQVTYQVAAPRGPALYTSPQFMLRPNAGVHVRLHVYPVSAKLDDTLIGTQAWFFIEPRDDVFQFDVLYRVYNFGSTTWVPNDLVLALPEGFKAFTAQEDMSDASATAVDDVGVRVAGTFSPGQHDVVFRFQVSNDFDSTVSFNFELPPHVAALQIETQAAPGMGMSADGFPGAQAGRNNRGQRVLTTARRMAQGEALKQLSITLTGVPNPGPGRWVAVFAALGLAMGGVAYAYNSAQQRGPSRVATRDLQQARGVILDELVSLERAFREGKIGPKTYEQARNALRDSLARLEASAPKGKSSQRRSERRRKGA